jgi:putative membrane-bound dehydrogenase-like protein
MNVNHLSQSVVCSTNRIPRWSRRSMIVWLYAVLALVHVGFGITGVCVLRADEARRANEEVARSWQIPGVHPIGHEVEESSSTEIWLQAYVRVPDAWARADGLLADSVTLVLESVVDGCEVLVNGKVIGRCGQVTSDLPSAREEVHRLKVPPGALQSGAYNTLTLRLIGGEGRAGFLARAPVLAGYHEEILLAGAWKRWDAAPLAESLVAHTVRPATAVFEQVTPATSVLRRPVHLNPGRHLRPNDSRASLEVTPDLVGELLLAEPQIAQPLTLDFDADGRLWVVEYRQYPYPAGINMISRDKFYRAAYDRMPAPPPNHAPGRDRISIHSDTNGDGQFDSHEIFLDGLNIVSSIEIMPEGVWVLNPPYLLFYPDHDQDRRPDGDPEVHLQGFGLEDTHSVANSLTWGPDGWLYGAQGSTTSSRVTVRGSDQPEVYRDGAMIWRYHPEQRRYEVFAEGGGNAFGIEIDAKGRLFSGHNGGNTRGFHYVQGGYCQKGTGGKYGPLSNPHAYGTIGPMPHADSPRFSHDFVIYDADQLPEHYHGHLLAIDPLQQQVIWATRDSLGSSFQTTDQLPVLKTSDFAFRPVDITLGPDGAIYVADFCEEYIAHGQNYQGQIDPETGRVYRLRAKNPASVMPTEHLATARAMSTEQLIERLSHANRWQRRSALRWLSHRAKMLSQSERRDLVEQLADCVRGDSGQLALEAFWAIGLIHAVANAGSDPAAAVVSSTTPATMGLHHVNPAVRAWAVRLLGDPATTLDPGLATLLVDLAAGEPNAEVRAQLAASCQRLPVHQALPILAALTRHEHDCSDPAIPLLLWWALEKHADHQVAVLELFRDPAVWQRPLAQQAWLSRLMRRYGSGKRAELERCGELLELAPNDATRRMLLEGFEAAFAGRSVSDLPPRLITALERAGGGSRDLRIRRKDAEAINEALEVLSNASVDDHERATMARLLGEIRQPEALPLLLKLAIDSETRETLAQSCLAALQGFDDPQIAPSVLQVRARWTPERQREADRLLASRANGARALLDAIRRGDVPADSLDDDTVRRLAAHRDPSIQDAIRSLWGDDRVTRQTRVAAEMTRVTAALRDGDADPYRGKPLFETHCAKCHQLFRDGGQIGPNLTSYRRDDAANMVLQIVNPSLEIREGFETWTIWTDDGRVVTGFLTDQDAQATTIRGVDGQNVTLARAEIEQLERSPQSLMPEGILAALTEQQLRDLFAYLRISQPLD